MEALVAKCCQAVTETLAELLLLFAGIVEVWRTHLVDDGTLVHPVGLVHVLAEDTLSLSRLELLLHAAILQALCRFFEFRLLGFRLGEVGLIEITAI